jgi:pimeloyl-ACP methyl ester carboxylesterase
MKKIIYIIPGWKESSQYKIYQSLAALAKKKGYDVIFYEIDWDKSLSSQIFPVQKNAIILGFSLGAILAHLIAQKYECRKLILASMTPLHSFKNNKAKKELIDLLGHAFVEDISKKLRIKNRARSQVIVYGDREGEQGDIIVPRTGHRLNARYIKELVESL